MPEHTKLQVLAFEKLKLLGLGIIVTVFVIGLLSFYAITEPNVIKISLSSSDTGASGQTERLTKQKLATAEATEAQFSASEITAQNSWSETLLSFMIVLGIFVGFYRFFITQRVSDLVLYIGPGIALAILLEYIT